jgi:hypothetical protein
MRIISSFLICWMALTSGIAQTCAHRDLGRQLMIITHSKRITTADGDSVIVKVSVTSERSRSSPQQIVFVSRLLRSEDWCHCRDVRSYVTGKNVRKEAIDNDFGDLIVVDFNFDGLEDVALKTDGGGNGGPYYTYYRQDEKGHFQIDHFLTDSVSFFPVKFHRSKKTITTRAHVDVGHEGETVYQYNPRTQTWRQISYRRVLM